MFSRRLGQILKKDLQTVPVVVVYGPRQVGKTTLVKQIAAEDSRNFLYLDLELPSDRIKLADAELFLRQFQDITVILDEVQFVPDLFPVLRSLIDENRRNGRFILLGSASPALLQRSGQSLAGRVRYRELFPFTLAEIKNAELNKLWFRGGFPGAFLTANDTEAMQWYADFMLSYSTRDLAQLGLPMRAMQIERLLQMLAHMHGQLINYSSIAKSLGVSQPTVTKAIFYLEEAMLIRTLKPWHNNLNKRLVKSPKVYIRDTGMLHYLLAVNNYNQLMGHPQAGNSWEGFVIQQILSIIPNQINPYFYRTAAGAEVGLILSSGNRIEYAVEIKLTNSPQLTRGNTEAISVINPQHRVIVIPTGEKFQFRDDWTVCGISEFIKDMDMNTYSLI